MTEISPHSGIIKQNIHYFPVRVYYEDTDVGGVVYYANYLKFMERARTEMLGCLDIDQKRMLDYNNAEDVGYVVKNAMVDFNGSAEFGNSLIVESRIVKMGGASVVFNQIIKRGESILVIAEIKVAAVGKDGKPKKLPVSLRHKFELIY